MKRFEDHNPAVLFLYFAMTTGICMFNTHPAIVLLSVFGGLLFYIINDRRCLSECLRTHLSLFGLFILISIINPLFYHNGVTVLFVLNNNPITFEALFYGICQGGMVISVIYWFRSFSRIMTSDRLLYVFGLLSPKVSLVISMTLRYIPLLNRQRKKTEAAQKAIGLYSDDSIISTIKGNTGIFGTLTTWALENGIITADSMTSRGYDTGKRTSFSRFRFTIRDLLFLLLSFGLFVTVLIFSLMHHFDITYYPEIQFVKPGFSGITGLICYGFLTILPTVHILIRELKWKYLRSKI